ncbi:hypothetical protein B6V73_00185 [Thioclava sp. JM3]|uniref:DUF2971 domain-containing protein n=1 Tax=Thioclava nitratireducens TaxID=1915078 RepID=A0ABN4XIA1_9RHOB|nr:MULTISPECIES: DUF2971 domain-containing protein [Thioclava]AQS49308.1 hypothetical protein BMG03_17045 [Thioclava nitratireducens]OWY18270.1 hypothetical protein B6V73_00185 [Thioclava sp. JM3]
MTETIKLPKRLYKYRAFSPRLLDMLVRDELYFSDPADFNDPLDCRPSLEADVTNDQLEQILTRMRQQRATAEMEAAAKSLRYRGIRTLEHINRQVQKTASQLLDEIRYLATDPSALVEDPLSSLLQHYIEKELLLRYDRGIVSFGSRSTCPLMWSHYGDQHNGICAAYSIPTNKRADLHKVQYGGSRMVRASDVATMDHDAKARRRVDEAVLLRKAASWRYEREWRLVGERGVRDSPLELEEVIFGIRCNVAVKFAIVQALSERERPIKFYEMHEVKDKFTLKKTRVDVDELNAHFPRRALSVYEHFD